MEYATLVFWTHLTFHHDHVDIYSTDWRLRQTLPFLQDPGDFTGWNPIVWFGPKRHQLPDGYTYSTEVRTVGKCQFDELSFNSF